MRLIKIVYAATLPPPNLSVIADECAYIWHEGEGGSHHTTSVIVGPRVVEQVVSAATTQWGRDADFRVIVLPVEAMFPVVARPTQRTTEDRLSRDEILADLLPSVQVTRTYVALVVLSTVVACVGLLRGDVAIIIGAMVIAPLLSPSVCLALASALADRLLARKAIATSVVGFGVAAAISVVVGIVLQPSAELPQLAARTRVDHVDLILALASGAAATLTVTTGLGGALVGVMVAVALLPPTATMAMLAGAGHWAEAKNAGILLVANLVGVNLAAVVTFTVQGVRPSTWWEQDRAKRARIFVWATWLVLLGGMLAIIQYGWS